MSGNSYSKKRKPSFFNHERKPATFQLEIFKLYRSDPSSSVGNMKSSLLYLVTVEFMRGPSVFLAFAGLAPLMSSLPAGTAARFRPVPIFSSTTPISCSSSALFSKAFAALPLGLISFGGFSFGSFLDFFLAIALSSSSTVSTSAFTSSRYFSIELSATASLLAAFRLVAALGFTGFSADFSGDAIGISFTSCFLTLPLDFVFFLSNIACSSVFVSIGSSSVLLLIDFFFVSLTNTSAALSVCFSSALGTTLAVFLCFLVLLLGSSSTVGAVDSSSTSASATAAAFLPRPLPLVSAVPLLFSITSSTFAATIFFPRLAEAATVATSTLPFAIVVSSSVAFLVRFLATARFFSTCGSTVNTTATTGSSSSSTGNFLRPLLVLAFFACLATFFIGTESIFVISSFLVLRVRPLPLAATIPSSSPLKNPLEEDTTASPLTLSKEFLCSTDFANFAITNTFYNC
uniref:Uncharacterized protein n=1 Tax=Ceratitis capitata TaxID=7213 RepID=W8B1M5_CERCA